MLIKPLFVLALSLCAPGLGQEDPEPDRILIFPEAGARVHGQIAFVAQPESTLGAGGAGGAGAGELLRRSLMAGGAEGWSAGEIEAWLGDRSAELRLRSDAGELRFELECEPADLDALIAIISALCSTPAYPDEVLAAAKGELIESIERRAADTGVPDEALLTRALTGATVPSPSAAALRGLGRADLLAFHLQALDRERAWVALSGGFEGATARAAIEEHLGRLPRPRGIPGMRMIGSRPGLRGVVIDVPGAARCELRFSLEVHAGHPRYVELLMLAEAFVQDPERNPDDVWALVPPSRLLPGYEAPLYLFRSVGTDADSIEQALDGALSLLDGPENVDESGFERLLGRRIALEEQRAAAPQIRLSRAIETARRFPASQDPWGRVIGTLAELGLEDLDRAAESLPAAPLTLIAVGPASTLAPALEPHMPVEVLGTVAPEPSTPEGRALAERLLDAVGGRERWRALRFVRTRSKAEVGEIRTEVGIEKSMDLEHGLLRVTQTIGDQSLMYVVTPESAWRLDGASVTDLAGPQAASLRERQERALVSVLRELARGTTGALRLGENGRLELVGPRGLWCWILPDDEGRPLRLGYQLEGEPRESVYLYSDWAEEQGLSYPRYVHQLDRGTEIETTSFEIEPGFAEGLFERR
jgi:hypothetical protein